MKIETVRIKCEESDTGFVTINVCDIKPGHEAFSDEDALLFPVPVLDGLEGENKDLKVENECLAGSLKSVEVCCNELKEANENLSTALKEADEEIVGLKKENANLLASIEVSKKASKESSSKDKAKA